MENWVLERDRYSVPSSPPHNFNLQDLDGPNRVEIFDITRIPSPHKGISETTCLCDIFGEDCESPCLYSSQTATSFLKYGMDKHLPTEEDNRSLGPYHKAYCSKHLSDKSDEFENLKDMISPNHTKDLPGIIGSSVPINSLTLPKSQLKVASDNGLLGPTKVHEQSPTDNQQVFQLSQYASPFQDKNTDSFDQEQITPTSEFPFGYHVPTGLQINTTDLEHARKPQECQLLQNPSPVQVKNMHSSDQQQLMSVTAFRCTNSNKTATTQDIITLYLLPENRDILCQRDPASFELKETNLKPKLITSSDLPKNTHVTQQIDITLYEPCKTDSTHKLITPDSLTENRGITKHTDTTSSVLWATDSTQNTITADLLSESKGITGQSPTMSEIMDMHSKQVIILPDLPEKSGITKQNDSVLCKLEETTLSQENGQPKQQESPYSEKQEHTVSFGSFTKSPLEVIASVASSMDYDRVGYLMEKEGQIPLPHPGTNHSLPIKETLHVRETIKGDCSIHLNNFLPHDSEFTPLQSCPSAYDVTHGLREMYLSPNLDYISSKSDGISEIVSSLTKPVAEQTALQAQISDSENSSIVPVPEFGFQDTNNNVFVPQCLTISTTNKMVFPTEHRKFSFLGMTDRIVSPEITELSSLSASSMGAISLSVTSSPSLDSLEKTNSGSLSSSDTNQCLMSEQKCFKCEYIPKLRSASCSLETSNILSQKPKSPLNIMISPQNKAPAQCPGVQGINCAEGSISTTQLGDVIKNPAMLLNLNLLETQDGLPTPSSSSSFPRDTVSLDVDVVRHAKCFTLNSDDITSLATSHIFKHSSTQGGISRSQSTSNIPKDLVSLDTKVITSSKLRSISLPGTENRYLATSYSSSLPSSLNLLEEKLSTLNIRTQISPGIFRNHSPFLKTCTPTEHCDNPILSMASEKVTFPLTANGGQVENFGKNEPCKSYSSALDKGINSAPNSEIQKIRDSTNEFSMSKSTLIENKETNSNSMSDFGQVNDRVSTAEIMERQSAGEKQLGHMAVGPGRSPAVLFINNDSKYEKESFKNKGWSKERVIPEEHPSKKGVCNITDEGGYREEQAVLSFNTRNRKGSAKHSPAPSSRDQKSEIPACYFESPLATREQQSLLRAQTLQKEKKIDAKKTQLTSHCNHSGAGHFPSDCNSETSKAGSEFNETDNEVKWFTGLAFTSLISSQRNYMDVYNSSHGSSTNISQSPTVDSTGASTQISDTYLHDLSLHETEDLLCHTSTVLPHDKMEQAKNFESGSFECMDIVIESKEEARKGKRMVPKRQIQFKKYNFDELKSIENVRNVMDSASTFGCLKDTPCRQHSAQPSVKDLFQGEQKIQLDKNMLQKVASIDETLTKTKKASSIIKCILSRKMDTATKESSGNKLFSADEKKVPKTIPAAESFSTDINSISSSISCSSTDSSFPFTGKPKESSHIQSCSCCRPKVPPKPLLKVNCKPPNSNAGDVDLQGEKTAKDQTGLVISGHFKIKPTEKHIFENEIDACNVENRFKSDLASAIVRTTNPTIKQHLGMQKRMTNREMDYMLTMKTHKQQNKLFLSKKSEITLTPCMNKEKPNCSIKSSPPPDIEISKDVNCDTPDDDNGLDTKVAITSEEENGKKKKKADMHEVMDIRKIANNSDNLSFKAFNTTPPEEDSFTKRHKQMQHPHLLHRECKAISWNEKQTACNKRTNLPAETQTSNKSKNLHEDSVIRGNTGISEVIQKSFLPKVPLELEKKQENETNVQEYEVDFSTADLSDKSNSLPTSYDNCGQIAKLPMPSRPSSKKVSTLVVLPHDTAKTVQNTSGFASPDDKTASSSHSVSMLLKEKGMQADIGICDVLNKGAGVKPKHINKLEVPLKILVSEGTTSEPQKMKKDALLLREQKIPTKSSQQICQCSGSSLKNRDIRTPPQDLEDQIQRASLQLSKEPEKSHYNSMTKTSTLPFSSSKVEIKLFTSNKKGQETLVTTSTMSKDIELPIQDRSMSNDKIKPYVLPDNKPPFAEIVVLSANPPKAQVKSKTPVFEKHILSATISNNEIAKARPCKEKTLSTTSSHKSQIAFKTISSSITALRDGQDSALISVQNQGNQKQQNLTGIREQVLQAISCASNYEVLPVVSQGNLSTQSPMRASSINSLHTEVFHTHATDDPPSYDERESFSPLMISDLPLRRLNRFHHTNKHSPCSCTTSSYTHFGQPCHGSQNQTPPVTHTPGQLLHYPEALSQAHVHSHQCRPDSQPISYQSVSPKITALAMIQPQHHLHTCPVPGIQPFCIEQQQPATQHMDRQSSNQRSPQASGAPYQEHSQSPNITAVNCRSQIFNPQELPLALSHNYESNSPGVGGLLYADNVSELGYGHSNRHVLLDPENGKYFYIEVPMHPMRKILFDPEIAQYVEVVISQQSMSHPGIYPPAATTYPPLHGAGLYVSHCLPYAVPPHLQSAQQLLHQVPSLPTTLHQSMEY